jgi:hypothetical protein
MIKPTVNVLNFKCEYTSIYLKERIKIIF